MKLDNRHAVKHELVSSIRHDPEFADLVEGLARGLAGKQASWPRTYASTRVASPSLLFNGSLRPRLR